MFLCVIASAMIVFTVASCSAVKKDCQGVKHYKTKGGFYI